MADSGSFEALEVENPKLDEEREENEFDDDDDDDDDDDEEDEDEDDERLGELQSSVAPNGAVLIESHFETLVVPSSIPLSETDQHASSQLLKGMPVNSTSHLRSCGEFKEPVGAWQKEVLVSVTVQAAEPQIENQVHSPKCPTFSSELSSTSVTQSNLSAPSPTIREQTLSPAPKGNTESVPEADQQNSPNPKAKTGFPSMKTPSADGYNWRKYGQKQVKSPKGSRSYYKCTFSGCYSKKIECCDHTGCVLEIIYKGRHNHEPPRKINSSKESRLASSAGPDGGNSLITHAVKLLDDPDSLTSSRESIQEPSLTPERKRQNSRDSDGDTEINIKEEQVVEPEPKRRLKKGSPAYPGSVDKPGKKPKLVVHAAGDVGISSDGYRWRKYGQKMVKGNPHPRNYYRCTSAGCPVRKHIERAVDTASTLIITYKGVHDHDMPVPKKRQGPPSAHLVAAAAPASMNNLQLKKCDTLPSQISSTQWSVDTEGELTGEALDLGGEKAMESARTLLSIGFEIKPC